MKYTLNQLERELQLLDVSNGYTCLATNEDGTKYVTEDNDLENILSRSLYTNMKHKEEYVLDMKLCCYNCGNIDKLNRKGKKFHCLKCQYSNDSDINAAMNIFHSRHILA